jgi:hypothetical protein
MSQPPRSEPTLAVPEPEWTFLRDGQVFGPVPESRLRDLLDRGEVDAGTLVSHDGSTYRPIAELSGFLVDLKKAEARQRVEREATASRRLAARRRLFRGTAGAVLALGLLGAAGGGAVWLATARPWAKRSALLEDFGAGIAVSVPARIGAGRERPAPPLEVEVPEEAAGPAPAARPARERPAPPVPPAGRGGRADEGELVASARWDPADIEGVVAREQRGLAPCLREEAARSPDFRGEIPIEFTIGNEGRVEALWIDEPRFRQGPLRDCLLRAMRGWRFQPFPGQRPVVSLSFRVGGA